MCKSVSGMGFFPSKSYKRSIRNNELKIMVSMSDDIDYSHIFRVKKSWDFIKSGEESHRIISGKSNLVFFFDSFYYKLFKKESVFKYFFRGVKHKSVVLMAAMNFISTVDISNTHELNKTFRKISLIHQKYNIEMWMFVVFKKTMIKSLVLCFGEFFDQNIINSWYICIRFCTDNIICRYNTSVSLLLNTINSSLHMVKY